MVEFTCTIKKFNEQGEKTGWTYIEVPEAIAVQLQPNKKKSFRVKGRFDDYAFEGVALIPMGGGNFIIPINAGIRKSIGKSKGAQLQVKLQVDQAVVQLSADLMQCLADDPAALTFFNKLPGSHQKYYSKWIEKAKTPETKAKRIAQTVTACVKKQQYSEMMKSAKSENDLFK